MNNLYKYDLENRFRFYQFNVTTNISLFDIDVLDENEKVVMSRTFGDEKTCYSEARIHMGIDPHIPHLVRPEQRDKLKGVPPGMEIIVEDSSTPPPYHKKQRAWGNEWIDIK